MKHTCYGEECKCSNNRIVVYGVGHNFKLLTRSKYIENLEMVALIDKYKAGSMIGDHQVLDVDEISAIDFDELFVLPAESDDIIEELQTRYAINPNKIVDSVMINKRIIESLGDYKFVFVGDDIEFLNYPYIQLESREDVSYFMPLGQGHNIFFNDTSDVINNSNNVFILRDHCYDSFSKEGLIDYLKTVYPNAHWTTVMSDMCEGEYGRLATRGDDYVLKLKNEFELVITYHSGDAYKYGLTHYEQTYPFERIHGTESYDVLFVGEAKNRIDLIHRAYLHMIDAGLDCRFWINHVDEEKQLKDSEIVYNCPMTYSEYLREVGKCRCIFEICQLNNESTYRYDEAVVNNKKFLFNDPTVINRKYYSNRYMQYFNTPEEIDTDWIKKDILVDYKYQNDYSPEHFLEFIENRLNQ